MQKTLIQLITDTERMIYQSVGPSVQVYSQDILAQKLQQAFDTIFQAKFWPQFVTREARMLDGVTGKTVTPFTAIKEWSDVQSVHRPFQSRPIPRMPLSYDHRQLTGSAAKFLEPAADTTLFTVYPLTALEEVLVVGRARPTADYASSDIVPFDHLALEHFATWSYLVDDESNPAQAAKHLGLFDSRIKQLWEDVQGTTVMLNPRSGEIPMEWR